MLETTTLSIGELAERWKQPARQILDAAVSLQIPVYALFNGLAFPLTDDHWLREGGDGQKRHELETMKKIIEDSEARITRCRMGKASEFDAMTPEEIIELRAQINKMQAECQAITDVLEIRRKDRLKREYIGLIRLPPRIIFNVLKGEKDVRMDMGLHPGYPVEVKPNPRIAAQSIADGALMWLEPAARVTLEHLVVLTEHAKTIEANKAASVALLPAQHAAPAPTQEAETPAPEVVNSEPAKRKNRKPSWVTVAMPYMKKLYASGKYRSCTVFYKTLVKNVQVQGSPFSMVKGALYCDEAGTTVAQATLGNVWKTVRAPQ